MAALSSHRDLGASDLLGRGPTAIKLDVDLVGIEQTRYAKGATDLNPLSLDISSRLKRAADYDVLRLQAASNLSGRLQTQPSPLGLARLSLWTRWI